LNGSGLALTQLNQVICRWVYSKDMMAHSIMWINVWAVDTLSDPSLKRANLRALEVSVAHVIKRYTNVLFTYLLTYLLAIVSSAGYCRERCRRLVVGDSSIANEISIAPAATTATQVGDERKLFSDLFSDYIRDVRPRLDPTQNVSITVDLDLNHIKHLVRIVAN